MKDWKVPKDIQAQTWSVIEYDFFNVVVPSTDSKPHDIEGYTCPCNPRTEVTEGSHMVVHNSWRDMASIDESLKKIFKNKE